MQHIILFIILSIMLIYHAGCSLIMKDGSNQLLIFGVYAFYGLCTIVMQVGSIYRFLTELKPGLPEILAAVLILLDIYCVVIFLMRIINSRFFRFGAFGFMMSELAVLAAAVIMWFAKSDIFYDFFTVCILVLGLISFVYGLVFFILKWSDIDVYYRILTISTYFMIMWFLVLLVFNLSQVHYLSVCGIGIGIYFVVYAVITFLHLRRRFLSKERFVGSDGEETVLTAGEKEILQIMSEKNITSSKDIAPYIDSTPTSIDTCVYRLRKKLHLRSRQDLIDYYKNSFGGK